MERFGLQQQSFKKPELAERHWYAPKVLNLVEEALEETKERSLLVVGCGIGDDAFLYADYLESKVVGIDLNERAIKRARQIVEQGPSELVSLEPRFLVGDITKREIVDELLRAGLGPFGVATFIGVMGSLITKEDICRGLINTRDLLGLEGKIVISDFAWWRPRDARQSWWEKRYRRDEKALRYCGIKGDVFGAIVVAPKGVHGEKLLSLSAEEVAQAIREGDYERFARHWRIGKIEEILKKAGFEVLRMETDLGRWDILDHLKEAIEERDLLLNYRILAKKIV